MKKFILLFSFVIVSTIITFAQQNIVAWADTEINTHSSRIIHTTTYEHFVVSIQKASATTFAIVLSKMTNFGRHSAETLFVVTTQQEPPVLSEPFYGDGSSVVVVSYNQQKRFITYTQNAVLVSEPCEFGDVAWSDVVYAEYDFGVYRTVTACVTHQ